MYTFNQKNQESKFTVSKDFLHVGLALTSSLQTTYLFSKKVDKGDIKPFQIKMTAARCIWALLATSAKTAALKRPAAFSRPHIGAFSFLQEIFRRKLILQKCFKIDIFGCYGTHLEGVDKNFEVLNSFWCYFWPLN